MKSKRIFNGCLISLILVVLSTCILSTVGLVAVMHGLVA
jgi:hypothetical protein